MRNERCETCRFWERGGRVTQNEDDLDEEYRGACHRMPKMRKTYDTHWCGEWKESADEVIRRNVEQTP